MSYKPTILCLSFRFCCTLFLGVCIVCDLFECILIFCKCYLFQSWYIFCYVCAVNFLFGVIMFLLVIVPFPPMYSKHHWIFFGLVPILFSSNFILFLCSQILEHLHCFLISFLSSLAWSVLMRSWGIWGPWSLLQVYNCASSCWGYGSQVIQSGLWFSKF